MKSQVSPERLAASRAPWEPMSRETGAAAQANAQKRVAIEDSYRADWMVLDDFGW